MVQVKGVEPIHPKALDPKSSASANSATPAIFMVTPRGIEPLLPPWKGGVLTAWPRSHAILSFALDALTLRSYILQAADHIDYIT